MNVVLFPGVTQPNTPPPPPMPAAPLTPAAMAAHKLAVRAVDSAFDSAYGGDAVDMRRTDKLVAAARKCSPDAAEVFADALQRIADVLRHGATKAQYGAVCADMADVADRAEAVLAVVLARRVA